MIPGVPERIDPVMQPIVDGLLSLLDLIDSWPDRWRASCSCGWKGEEFDNEADSELAMLTHAEQCNAPWWRAWCGCGWTGEKRDSVDRAQSDMDAHRPCDLPVVRTSAPAEDSHV